jgi:alkylation response protein AidB-like acyl-CoA dehydrogenase
VTDLTEPTEVRDGGPADLDAFRAEARSWLEEHCVAPYRGLEFQGDPDSVWLTRMRAWNNLMADDGWAGIDWPVEHGGRGLGLAHQVVLAEELDRARAPSPLNPIGLANIAPSIMAFGTPAQTGRYLRPMLRGDEIWCQGFSEPDAGSDLASLATKGRRDGDDWIISGQKVWNTYGQLADWCELLVRTDPTASKHRGITCLLVDMKTPGIEVRPLRTATGDEDFCELFFDEVRVPDSARLGPVGDGWTVAMATLSFERSGVANLHIRTRRHIRELIEEARAAGRTDDPVVRQELAQLYIDAELQRLLSERATTRALQGLPPGPEGSLIKLVWSRVGQLLPLVATRILGPGSLVHDPGSDPASEPDWGTLAMGARSLTIAGGTTEVNKNILAERVLGLPRDPKPT